MSENPYDPNVRPDLYMAWIFAENRRRYLKRFPEERRVMCFETANFHKPFKTLTPATKTKKKRR